MSTFFSELKTSLVLTVVLAVITCGVYPLAVWTVGQNLFRDQANGSLLVDPDGTVRGSRLLAQNFSSDKYFQPRPSAAGNGYDPTSSSGTNLGPTSAKLVNGTHALDTQGKRINDPSNFDGIVDLIQAYRTTNHLLASETVPADAVTRSASGLDPHISLRNAALQAVRVASSRGLSIDKVQRLIEANTDDRSLGLFGEPGVNVLMLNRALDLQTVSAK